MRANAVSAGRREDEHLLPANGVAFDWSGMISTSKLPGADDAGQLPGICNSARGENRVPGRNVRHP